MQTHHAHRTFYSHEVRGEGCESWAETDAYTIDMFHGAFIIGTGTCTVLAGGVTVGQVYLAEETEDLALSQWHIGAHEDAGVVVVFEIVEIGKTDIEVFAEVQVKLTEVKVISGVVKACAKADVLGHEISEVGTDGESMTFDVDILQNEVVEVVAVPFVESDRTTEHPLSLWHEGGIQIFARYSLDMSSPFFLTLEVTFVEG